MLPGKRFDHSGARAVTAIGVMNLPQGCSCNGLPLHNPMHLSIPDFEPKIQRMKVSVSDDFFSRSKTGDTSLKVASVRSGLQVINLGTHKRRADAPESATFASNLT